MNGIRIVADEGLGVHFDTSTSSVTAGSVNLAVGDVILFCGFRLPTDRTFVVLVGEEFGALFI
jgi:hypothetical protein